MPPLAFSDSELDTLMSLSTPLHPSRRAEYLEAVAAAIAEYPERGDGLTNRVARELQGRYMHALPNVRSSRARR